MGRGRHGSRGGDHFGGSGGHGHGSSTDDGGRPKECFYCHEPGHFARECRKKAKDEAARNFKPNRQLALTTTRDAELEAEWHMDSGASCPITPHEGCTTTSPFSTR